MRKTIAAIALLLLLFLALAGQTPALAQSAGDGVVHAVLFFSPTCSHCHQVMTEVLPPLQEKYGDRLKITNVDTATGDGYTIYKNAIEMFKIPADRQGVPALIIGDAVLVGGYEIPNQLPGLIEQHLAKGGVALPPISGLSESSGSSEGNASGGRSFESDPVGHALSIFVLTGMAVSLALAVWQVSRRGEALFQPGAVQPDRLKHWAIPLLALVGLGVASYLSYVETQNVSAICGPIGDCNAVQASSYSRLFGVVPIAVFGLTGYLVILALWGWIYFRSGQTAELAALGLLGATLFGTAFSTYLTYLEPFVLHAVCTWCLTSAVVMTALMVLSTRLLLQEEQPIKPQNRRQVRKRRPRSA